MGKPIEKYLPKKEKLRPIQGNVDITMFSQVDNYRNKKDLTWSELIVALFKRLLDEEKNKPT